jgi:Zn-dependent protease with chaperone function
VLKKIKLVGIFLAVPVICFFALGSALSDEESAWNRELQKHFSSGRARELGLPIACYNITLRRSIDLTPVCSPYEKTKALTLLAILTAAATIFLAGLIMAAGVVSRSNRNVLVRVFRPGFVVSNILVAVLLLLQAVLLSGTYLYAVNNGSVDGNFYFYGVLFGLAALAGAFFTLKPLFGRWRVQATVVGRSVKRSEYPRLWQFVDGLVETTGSERPQNVVVGLTPEFFVTEAEVQCLDGALSGRTMYLSAPLSRILTPKELSAVIAHELGHFKGADTAFTLRFYPIYRGAADSLQGVAQTAVRIAKSTQYIPFVAFRIIGWIGSLSLYPSLYMMGFFLECFAGAERNVSREREIAADAVAAETAGADNIATALVKIVAFTHVWDFVVSEMRNGLLAGYLDVDGERHDARQFFTNVSEVYARTAAAHAGSHALDGLDAKTIPHPTDSHPPLSVRLAALRQNLSDIRSNALDLLPCPSGNEVVDNFEDLERQLSMAEQAMLCPEQVQRIPAPQPPMQPPHPPEPATIHK